MVAHNSYQFIQHAGGDIDEDVEMSMESEHARQLPKFGSTFACDSGSTVSTQCIYRIFLQDVARPQGVTSSSIAFLSVEKMSRSF